MLKRGDKLFGIELNSSTFGYHQVWFIEDKKGNLFGVGKRKIKAIGKKVNVSNIIEREWNIVKNEHKTIY